MSEKIKLGEIIDTIQGSQYPLDEQITEYKEGYFRFLRISDYTKSDEPIRYVKYSGKELVCEENEVVVVRYGNVGFIGYGKKGILANNLFVLRLKNEKFDSKYLYYYLNSPNINNAIVNKANSSTMPALTHKMIKDLEIPIVDIEKQKCIVNELDKIQKIIDIREEQIEYFDELIKSQFVEMFESKDYNKATIGKCAKFQGGYAFKSKDFVENGVKLVQISNVNKDTLDWIEINRVPESFIEKYKEYSLVANDVVMAMTRPIIKSLNEVKIAQVREDDLPCLLNQRVGRFIINDSVNKEYLTYCCKSDKFKNYVEKMSGNSLQPNISSKQVENFEISLPPIELQNKFAEFVKQIDKQKFEIENSLKEMQELYESLMEKYFG